MVVFGVNDTMKALEMSAIDKLLLFEDVEMTRYVIKNPVSGDTRTYYLTPFQEKDAEGKINPKYFLDADSGNELEILESEPFGDWLLVNYQQYGAKIELITDKTAEGYQFVKGFGGIGGSLRYAVDLDEIKDEFDEDIGGEDFDPDEDFI